MSRKDFCKDTVGNVEFIFFFFPKVFKNNLFNMKTQFYLIYYLLLGICLCFLKKVMFICFFPCSCSSYKSITLLLQFLKVSNKYTSYQAFDILNFFIFYIKTI